MATNITIGGYKELTGYFYNSLIYDVNNLESSDNVIRKYGADDFTDWSVSFFGNGVVDEGTNHNFTPNKNGDILTISPGRALCGGKVVRLKDPIDVDISNKNSGSTGMAYIVLVSDETSRESSTIRFLKQDEFINFYGSGNKNILVLCAVDLTSGNKVVTNVVGSNIMIGTDTYNTPYVSLNHIKTETGDIYNSNPNPSSEEEAKQTLEQRLQKLEERLTALDNPTSGLPKATMDRIYPIGSLFISVNQQEPDKIFIGTEWERISKSCSLWNVGLHELANNGSSEFRYTEGLLPRITGEIAFRMGYSDGSQGVTLHPFDSKNNNIRMIVGESNVWDDGNYDYEIGVFGSCRDNDSKSVRNIDWNEKSSIFDEVKNQTGQYADTGAASAMNANNFCFQTKYEPGMGSKAQFLSIDAGRIYCKSSLTENKVPSPYRHTDDDRLSSTVRPTSIKVAMWIRTK